MENSWGANISEAREKETEKLSNEGTDGNKTYDKSGTYGQSDFTVRERESTPGTYDVYIKSDSDKGYSHDVIDENGNLIASYHDIICHYLKRLSFEELQIVESTSKSEYLRRSARVLMRYVKAEEFEEITRGSI